MSAHDVETLLGTGLLAVAGIWTLFELPSWIVRRCER